MILSPLRWLGRPGHALHRILLACSLSAILALRYFISLMSDDTAMMEYVGVESSMLTKFMRHGLNFFLIVSPPVLLAMYEYASLLAKYVTRQVVVPLFFCLIGFLSILIVMDLTNNSGDFADSNATLSEIAYYYSIQLPALILLIAPYSLLLAILYGMGKMSKSNEIISMLTAGKSLWGILTPVFFIGIYFSLIGTALNFEWAPEALRAKASVHRDIMDKGNDGQRMRKILQAAQVSYVNKTDKRYWYIHEVPVDLRSERLQSVDVIEVLPNHFRGYFFKRAHWIRNTKEWRLINGEIIEWDKTGELSREIYEENDYFVNWHETPWILMAGSLEADELGLPSLLYYVNENKQLGGSRLKPFHTHLWYRWALPWSSFVIALLAAPLGVVFSRRGAMGGVAGAVFVAAGFIFLDKFFLTLGQSGELPPILGAWLNNLAFGALGLYFLLYRARNKEIPRLSLAPLFRIFSKGKRNHIAPSNDGVSTLSQSELRVRAG